MVSFGGTERTITAGRVGSGRDPTRFHRAICRFSRTGRRGNVRGSSEVATRGRPPFDAGSGDRLSFFARGARQAAEPSGSTPPATYKRGDASALGAHHRGEEPQGSTGATSALTNAIGSSPSNEAGKIHRTNPGSRIVRLNEARLTCRTPEVRAGRNSGLSSTRL